MEQKKMNESTMARVTTKQIQAIVYGIICDIDLFGVTNFYTFNGENKELITKTLSSVSDICYTLENLLLSSNSNLYI